MPGGFCTSLSRIRATAVATCTASTSAAPFTRRRMISTSRSRVRVGDPVVEAAALDRVVQVARAVRGQHDDRRVRRADRADLRDRHARVGEQLEQERLEVVVGAVDLVDQQHRRPRPGVLERAQQRPPDQVVRPEQVLLAQRRRRSRRRAGSRSAGAGSSTRTAPRRRRSPRSTAAAPAACRARRRAPWRPRSCRPPPRPRAAAAAAGAGRGTSRSPGPRRPGSRRSARRCAERLDVGSEVADLVAMFAARRTRRESPLGIPVTAAARDGPASPRQTRAGVHGMSMWSTPCVACSASITALTIAGGEPTLGDSPTPFAPSGWCGQGVTVSPSSKSGHSSAVGIR